MLKRIKKSVFGDQRLDDDSQKSDAPARKKAAPGTTGQLSMMLALEPRFMFDAAVAVAAGEIADAVDAAGPESDAADVHDSGDNSDAGEGGDASDGLTDPALADSYAGNAYGDVPGGAPDADFGNEAAQESMLNRTAAPQSYGVGPLAIDNGQPWFEGPNSFYLNQDEELILTGISVDDAEGDELKVTLEIGDSWIDITAPSGCAINRVGEVDGAWAKTIELTGSREDISTALGSLVYKSADGYSGNDMLTLTAIETDADAAGQHAAAVKNIGIAVNRVTEQPEHSFENGQPWFDGPGYYDVDEDARLVFGSNGIVVNDWEDGDRLIVKVTVTEGWLSISDGTGYTLSYGSESNASLGYREITIVGEKNYVTSALESLVYQGDADFYGSDTLRITAIEADAEFASWHGVAEKDIVINVAPVNDKPVINIPVIGEGEAQWSVKEDEYLPFYNGETDSYLFGITDPDDDDTYSLYFEVSKGELYYSGEWLADSDNGVNTYSIAGLTKAEILTFLKDIRYKADIDYNGQDDIVIKVVDSGGKEDSRTVRIQISNVEDLPVWHHDVVDIDGDDVPVGPELAVEEGGLTILNGIHITQKGQDITAVDGYDAAKEYHLVIEDVDSNPNQIRFEVSDLPGFVEGGSTERKGEILMRIGGSWVMLGEGSQFTLQDVIDGNIAYRHLGSQVRESRYEGSESDSFTISLSNGTHADGEFDLGKNPGQENYKMDMLIRVALSPKNQNPGIAIPGPGDEGCDDCRTEPVYNLETDEVTYKYAVYEGESGAVVKFVVTDPDQNAGTPFTVKVTETPVHGALWYKAADDGPWVKVVNGMELDMARVDAGNLVYNNYGYDGDQYDPAAGRGATRSDSFKVEAIDDGGGEGVALSSGEVAMIIEVYPANDMPELAEDARDQFIDSSDLTNVADDYTETNVIGYEDLDAGWRDYQLVGYPLKDGVTTPANAIDITRITDRDSYDGSLTYTITGVSASGKLYYRVAVEGGEHPYAYRQLGVGSSFTQADVDSGNIVYRFEAGAGEYDFLDTFTLTVSDGARSVVDQSKAVGPDAVSYDGSSNYHKDGFEGGIGTVDSEGNITLTEFKLVVEMHCTINEGGGTTYPPISDPVLHFTGDKASGVYEGGYVQITAADLNARLQYDNGTQVTSQDTCYRVESAFTHGVIVIAKVDADGNLMYDADGNLEIERTVPHCEKFTQSDIDAGRVFYKHYGSEQFSDTMKFSISDGSNVYSENGSSLLDYAVVVTPVNDRPVVEAGDTQIEVREGPTEGQAAAGEASFGNDGIVLTTDHIKIYDVDTSANKSAADEIQIIFTSPPANGRIEYQVSPGVWETVVYGNSTDFGSDSAPDFTKDPSLWTSGLQNDEGDTVTIVTLADLRAGKVRYVHNGDEVYSDAIKLMVNDGKGFHAALDNVDLAKPEVSGSYVGPVVKGEDGKYRYTAGETTEEHEERAGWTYTLKSGSETSVAEIRDDLNRVVYKDGVWLDHDSTVAGRHGSSLSSIAVIGVKITPINDKPFISGDTEYTEGLPFGDVNRQDPNAGAPIHIIGDGGSSGSVANGVLKYEDYDNFKTVIDDGNEVTVKDPTQLVYEITEGVRHGALYINKGTASSPRWERLEIGSSFTQQDVDDGKIGYVHNGGEDVAGELGEYHGDSFTFTVFDGDSAKMITDGYFAIGVEIENAGPVVERGNDGPFYLDDENGMNLGDVFQVDDPDYNAWKDSKGGDGKWASELDAGGGLNDGADRPADLTGFVPAAGEKYGDLMQVTVVAGQGYVWDKTTNSLIADPAYAGASQRWGHAEYTGAATDIEIAVNADGDLVLIGSKEALNEALKHIVLMPEVDGDGDPIDLNGMIRVHLIVDDLGNGDRDGLNNKFAHDVIDVCVSIKDNPPEFEIERQEDGSTDSQFIIVKDEDCGWFSVTVKNGNNEEHPVRVGDIDHFDQNVNEVVIECNGDLGRMTAILNGVSGIVSDKSGISADGTRIVVRGTNAAINEVLASLRYRPNDDAHGADVITITYSDGYESGGSHHIGTGAGQIVDGDETFYTIKTEIDIVINPVNDAPEFKDELTEVIIIKNDDTAATAIKNGDKYLSLDDIDIKADSGSNPDLDQLQVTITASNNGTPEGKLSLLPGATDGLGVAIDPTNDGSNGVLVICGTRAQINDVLKHLGYTPVTGCSQGTDIVLRFDVDDLGNGSPLFGENPLSAVATVKLHVNSAVNRPPEVTIPQGGGDFDNYDDSARTVDIAMLEDGTLVFKGDKAIAIVDKDNVQNTAIEVVVSVEHGTLTMGRTSMPGVDIQCVDGVYTLKGTQERINAVLSGMTYTPTANWNGTDVMTITTNDFGEGSTNTTETGIDTATWKISIEVEPQNDKPILLDKDGDPAAGKVTVEAPTLDERHPDNEAGYDAGNATAQTVEEYFNQYFSDGDDAKDVDGGAVFSNANQFIGVYVSAVDKTQASTKGTWQYNTGSGWADIDQGMFLRADVEIRFNPVMGYNTANAAAANNVTPKFEVRLVESNGDAVDKTDLNDWKDDGVSILKAQANCDIDALKRDGKDRYTDIVAVTAKILAVNNPPSITFDDANGGDSASGRLEVNEDASILLTKNGTSSGSALFVVNDDASENNGIIEVAISAENGELSLGKDLVGITSGWTNASEPAKTITITGTVKDINAALKTLTYKGDQDYNGHDTITVAVDDKGSNHTAAGGGSLTCAKVIHLDVKAVNDAPVVGSGSGANATVPTGSIKEDLPVSESDAYTFEEWITGQMNGGGTLGDGVDYYGDARDRQKGVGNDEGSEANGFAGVMVVGNVTTNGNWQYWDPAANGNQGDWVDIGARSDENALFLTADTKVRFNPNSNYNGEAPKLDLRLVDDSTPYGTFNPDAPAHGASANIAGKVGGASRYSDHTVSLSLTVTSVDDAPTLSYTGNSTVTINEDGDIAFVSGGAAQIQIGDVDAGTGDVTVTINAGHGALGLGKNLTGITGWTNSSEPAKTITITGTLADINAALKTLTYKADHLYHGTDAITVVANDRGNTGEILPGDPSLAGDGVSLDSNTIAIDVVIDSVNNPPEIDAPTLTIAEDATKDGFVNLTNGGAVPHIAVDDPEIGSAYDPEIDGTSMMTVTLEVEYGLVKLDYDNLPAGLTVKNGTNGEPDSAGDKKLVITGARDAINDVLETLQYKVDSDWNGADPLKVTVTDAAPDDLASATATKTIGIAVTAVNDAPVVKDATSGNKDISFGEAQYEDAAGIPAKTVDELFGGSGVFDDSADQQKGVGNNTAGASDQDDFAGVVVVGVNQATGKGVWKYLPPGADGDVAGNWVTLPSNCSESNGLFLAAGTKVRFEPVLDFNGDAPDLQVHLVDSSSGAPAHGATVNLSGVGKTGGATCYSTDTVTLKHAVTAVNDAPIVGSGSGQDVAIPTGGIDEDSSTGVDDAYSFKEWITGRKDSDGSALGNGVNYFNDSKDTVGGGSSANNLAGVMVVGNDTTNGDWQYWDPAANGNQGGWVDIGTRGDANALFLNADTKVRFKPNDDFTGAAPALALRLVDDSTSSGSFNPDAPAHGGSANIEGKVGGTSRYSEHTVSLTQNVIAFDDAPTISYAGGSRTIAEDGTIAFGANPIQIADVDAEDGEMMVTISAGNGALGLGGGLTGITGWTDASTPARTIVIKGKLADINEALKTLTYTADHLFHGNDAITVVANDQGNTGEVKADDPNLAGDGGSLDSDPLVIAVTVESTNNPPEIGVPNLEIPEDANNGDFVNLTNGGSTPHITVTDPEIGSTWDSDIDASSTLTVKVEVGFGVIRLGSAPGALTVTDGLGGAADSAGNKTLILTGAQADINKALESLQYKADADWNGADALTVTATDTAPGGTSAATTSKTVDIAVTAVNDAPEVLGAAGGNKNVDFGAAQPEDATTYPSKTVDELFGHSGVFGDAADQQNGVNGNDTAGASDKNDFAGVVVVGISQAPAKGVWKYLDPGADESNSANWKTLPSCSESEALFLAAGTKVRFEPALDFNGDTPDLKVRLVETASDVLDHGAIVNLAGSGKVGGSTRYSRDTVTLKHDIDAVNDSPVVKDIDSKTVDYGYLEPDSGGVTSGFKASDLFGKFYDDSKDDVPGGTSADAFHGVLVTGITDKGSWQKVTDTNGSNNPANWTWGAVSVGDVLKADDVVRFVPTFINNVVNVDSALTVKLVDSFDSSQPGHVNPAAVDDTNLIDQYSENEITVRLTIGNENDPPDIAPPGQVAGDENTWIDLGTGFDVVDRNLDELGGGAGNWGGASLAITGKSGSATDGKGQYGLYDGVGGYNRIAAGTLEHGGKIIGSVSKSDGGELRITFADGVTTAEVEAFLDDLAYKHASRDMYDADPDKALTLEYVVNDGNTRNTQGHGGAMTSAVRTQDIVIRGVDDAPEAVDDTAIIALTEDDSGNLILGDSGSVIGGLFGVTGRNVTSNDIEHDANDAVSVTTIAARPANGAPADTKEFGVDEDADGIITVGGKYGVLRIAEDGGYTYTLKPEFQDLLKAEGTLREIFDYEIVDSDGKAGHDSGASLVITLTYTEPAVQPDTVHPDVPQTPVTSTPPSGLGEGGMGEGQSPIHDTVSEIGDSMSDVNDGLSEIIDTIGDTSDSHGEGGESAEPAQPGDAGDTEHVDGPPAPETPDAPDAGADPIDTPPESGDVEASDPVAPIEPVTEQPGAAESGPGLDEMDNEPAFGDVANGVHDFDAMSWSEEIALVAQPESRNVYHDHHQEFKLPESMFVHSDPNERLDYEAAMSDGSPLPPWIEFDPETMSIRCTPPKDLEGVIEIVILVRDSRNNYARTVVSINIRPPEAMAEANGLKEPDIMRKLELAAAELEELTEELEDDLEELEELEEEEVSSELDPETEELLKALGIEAGSEDGGVSEGGDGENFTDQVSRVSNTGLWLRSLELAEMAGREA